MSCARSCRRSSPPRWRSWPRRRCGSWARAGRGWRRRSWGSAWDGAGRRLAAGRTTGRRCRAPARGWSAKPRHQAGFVSYRVKDVDSVLGQRHGDPWPASSLRRVRPTKSAQAGSCKDRREHGDPGLARMTARASANEPFARASVMLAELAGVPVTAAGSGTPGIRQVGGRRDRGAGRRDPRPQDHPAAARRPAGQDVHSDRRHRRADDDPRDRRPPRQERGRQGPHPRGETRLRVHPGQGR